MWYNDVDDDDVCLSASESLSFFFLSIKLNLVDVSTTLKSVRITLEIYWSVKWIIEWTLNVVLQNKGIIMLLGAVH